MTTTTISQEQRAYAEGRIHAAGLQERVRVLGADYRELTGSYDRLASIEMIEAVGWEYFDTFFERCSALLAPHGLMFLQAIAIDDRAYEGEKSARSFSNTLIFPGGSLPSLGAIQHSVTRRTDMRPVLLEDIGASYVLTLRHWRQRFLAASEQLAQLGYDSAFAASGGCTSRSRRLGFTRHACATCNSSTRSRRGRGRPPTPRRCPACAVTSASGDHRKWTSEEAPFEAHPEPFASPTGGAPQALVHSNGFSCA